jgi:hypothetical protein
MFMLFNDDEGIPVPGTEEWYDHMREEQKNQASCMRILGQEAVKQSHKQGTNSEFKLQDKRARGSQSFSIPLVSELKNDNAGLWSRSETEPRKKRRLNTTHLWDSIVASPNKVSIAHVGNPGADVDCAPATDVIIKMD